MAKSGKVTKYGHNLHITYSHTHSYKQIILLRAKGTSCDILVGVNVITIASSKAAGDCLLLNQMTDRPHTASKCNPTQACMYMHTHGHTETHTHIPPMSQEQIGAPQALKGGARGPSMSNRAQRTEREERQRYEEREEQERKRQTEGRREKDRERGRGAAL